MAELHEERMRYYIPDNFIEEGRVFGGRIRLRYLIEAIILTLGSLLLSWIIVQEIPDSPLQLKICIFIVLCAPPFVFGNIGYNGDPISVAIKSAYAWRKHKTMMIYNPHARLLIKDPVDEALNQISASDNLATTLEERQREKIERKANMRMVEGEDFEFAEDPDIDAYIKKPPAPSTAKAKSKTEDAPESNEKRSKKRVDKKRASEHSAKPESESKASDSSRKQRKQKRGLFSKKDKASDIGNDNAAAQNEPISAETAPTPATALDLSAFEDLGNTDMDISDINTNRKNSLEFDGEIEL